MGPCIENNLIHRPYIECIHRCRHIAASFLLVLLTYGMSPPAHADGKFFVAVAPDTINLTIPHERAIIGWNPPRQTLAIDTTFIGDGNEFAWLVPLPSRPEITAISPGVFEAAAAITAPRVDTKVIANPFISMAIYLTFTFAFLIFVHIRHQGSRSSAVRVVTAVSILFILLFIFAPAWFLPGLAVPRGAVSSEDALATDPSVTVISRSRAGVYDTVVLEVDAATDLFDWLSREGFHAPQGIESVVQNFIEMGWVFAAARVNPNTTTNANTQTQANDTATLEDPPQNMHRLHPLLFTFNTDRPVYPMALTAVGNTAIQLDLYILADGTPRTPHLTTNRSLTATRTDPSESEYLSGKAYSTRDQNNNPRLVHEELDDISLGRANITHLSGTRSPTQQSKDIFFVIGQFAKQDPLFILRSKIRDAYLDYFFWPATITLGTIYVLLVFGRITRSAAIRGLKYAAVFIPVLSISAGLAASNNVYEGNLIWQRGPKFTFNHTLEAVVEIVHGLDLDARVSDENSIADQIMEHLREHFSWRIRANPLQLEQAHNRGAPMTFRVLTDPQTGEVKVLVRCPAGQIIMIDADTGAARTLQ